MANQTEEDLERLNEIQTEILQRLLPLIVFLIILGIFGFLGNLLAIIFYFTKTKHTSAVRLIACLAVADLVVCILFIPNIVEISVNVIYTQTFLCKLSHFAGLWTICVSCLILGVIAIDRHRKICNPFGKHFELHYVKRTVIGIVIFGFFLAFRDFFTFDTTEVIVETSDTNRTLMGYFCTTRDDANYRVPVTLFTAIDFLIILIIWMTLIVSYSHIIYTLYFIIKTEDRLVEKSPESATNEACSTDSPAATAETDLSYISVKNDTDGHVIASFKSNTEFSSADYDEPSNTNESTTEKVHKKKHNKHNSAMCAIERNLTLMMFVVSLVFFFCFTPYFVVKILMRSVLQAGEEFEFGLGVQFALRLPYMNSVFNPVIYCYFNPHFRAYVKNVFLSCCRRK